MPTREKRAKALGVPVDDLPDARGKHSNHRKGSDHYRWNTARILSDHGYRKIRVGTDHPLADPNGYAYEHLLVWVSAGRPRPPHGALLHHANEDKTDNRLGNLELLDRGEHSTHHNANRDRDDNGRFTS